MTTSPTDSQSPKPPARLEVNIAGQDRTLFMSFGLLNELASLVGGPENIPMLSFNAEMSSQTLTLVLAKRNKRGGIIEPTEDEGPIIPLDLDPEAGEAIIDWVAAHTLDFFVRRFSSSVKMFGEQAGKVSGMGSSLTSSRSSLGKTP